MGAFVAEKVVKLMIQKDHKIKDSRALIMGITFKENCPDIRNARAVDIYHQLEQFGLAADIVDPWADAEAAHRLSGLAVWNGADKHVVNDALVVAVDHSEFLKFDY